MVQVDNNTVLFVSDSPLLPATNGGRVASLSEVRALQKLGMRVVVVLACDREGEIPFHAGLHRQVLGEAVIPYSRRNHGDALVRWPWLPSIAARRMVTRAEAKGIARAVEAFGQPFAILCAHDFMLPVARRLSGSLGHPPILLRSHNDEFRFLLGTALATTGRRLKLARLINALRFLAVRRSLVRQADHVAMLSPADRTGYAAVQDRLTVVPPILTGGRSLVGEGAALAGRASQPNARLLFIGALDSPATCEGLIWFAERVWPLVREVTPEAVLRVVGRGASVKVIEQLEATPGVSYGGEVPDLTPELDNARLFVNPVLRGSGVNMKMGPPAEAGLPIVTTTLGARGLDSLRGGMSIADTPAEMTAACGELIQDDTLWREKSGSLVRHIHRDYSAEAVGRTLVELLRQL